MPNERLHCEAPTKGFPLPTGVGAAGRPLQGLTILAVEDSRYACEALRLMCQRAGARLRRAETLVAARAHLRVYRPDVVIIDLGLPDGRGEALIRDLVMSPRRPAAIFGTSGNATGRNSALASGADGFLDKPMESYAKFCAALCGHLSGLSILGLDDSPIQPDPLALQDDFYQAAAALDGASDPVNRKYVTGFLQGLASHAHDRALAQAVTEAAAPNSTDNLEALRVLVDQRLGQRHDAFCDQPSFSPTDLG